MKILKWIGIIILFIIALLVIIGVMENESLPAGGQSGQEADKMAVKMENALGKKHWHDIQYVQWSFMGIHHFLWDKHRNLVRVKTGEQTVYIKPGSENGLAFNGTEKMQGEAAKDALKDAEKFFNNDMFWLVAPFKTFDEGATRQIVSYEGEDRLLVSYSSGGTTPGDSYLWKLAEDGTPESYKMWTQILPIGGLETSWENYHTFGNGVRIAHLHKGSGPISIVISDVATGYNYEEMNCEKDPFKILIEQ